MRIVNVMLILLMMTLSGRALWSPVRDVYTSSSKHDWRGVARYLLRYLESDDVLLTDTAHIHFYLPELAPKIERLRGVSSIESNAKIHSRVWILSPGNLLGQRQPDVQEWVEEVRPVQVVSSDTRLKLYVYSVEMDSSQIIEQILHSEASGYRVFPSSDILERALAAGYVEEASEVILHVLTEERQWTESALRIAIESARRLSDQGEHSKATDILTAVTAVSDCQGWITLGLVHQRQNRVSDSVVAFRKAVECDPSSYWANHFLARTFFRRKEWQRVIQLEERAYRVAADDSLRTASLILMARAHSELGDEVNACNTLRQAYDVQQSREVLSELATLGCGNEP